jgi:hypothetical protein
MLRYSTQQGMERILLMLEASRRYKKQSTLEESLKTGSLGFLLTEELDKSEAQELQAAVDEQEYAVKQLVQMLGSAGLGKTKAYFETVKGSLPQKGDLVGMAIAGDSKAMAKATSKTTATMAQITAATDSIYNAFVLLDDNLSQTEWIKNADANALGKTLGETAKNPDANGKGFPSEDTLRKGIERSFVPSKSTKGFFGKIMGLFKGSEGAGKLDKGVFVDEMMTVKLDVMTKLAEMARSEAPKIEDQATDQAELAQDNAEDIKGDEGGDKAGGDDKKESGASSGEISAVLDTATAQSGTKPLGAEIGAALKGLFAKFEDDEDVQDGLKQLALDMKKEFKNSSVTLTTDLTDVFNTWYQGTVAKNPAIGDAFSTNDIKAMQTSFEEIITNNMKFESLRRQSSGDFLTEVLVSAGKVPHQEVEGDGFIDTMADRDSPWSEDELVRHKWLRAAGIKGY